MGRWISLGITAQLRAWNSAARIIGRRWGDGGQRRPCVLLCPAGREWPLFGRGCRRRKNGRLPVSAEAGLKNQCGIWLHQDHLSGSMPGNQGTIPAKRRNRAAAGGKERPAYKKGFICSTLACSVDSSFSAKDRTCRSFPS